jgi:phosphodiesterase/alkaline phosphatase D-like protein
MKTRIAWLTIAILLLAGMALAQAKEVEITKGPVVEHTGGSDAVIAWSTNVSSSTVVKYGTDRHNLAHTAQAPWGGTTHRVTLKNLEPGKTYYYQVTSAQAQGSGTGDIGPIEQFTTQGSGRSGAQANNTGGKPDKLHISNGPDVEHAGSTDATIAWTTDLPSSSIVKYGTDGNNLSQTAEEPWGATTHRVQLKNLKPGTQYFYVVHSAQGKNAPGESEDTQRKSFTTQGSSAQASNSGGKPDKLHITNGPVIEHVGDTNATIAWTTDLPASSIVKYGTDGNNLSQTAEQPWGATTHRVQLKNLRPGTQYFFSVHSAQGKNAPGEAEDTPPKPFTTAAQGQQAKK